MKTTRHAASTLNSHIVWVLNSRNSELVDEVADRVQTILHKRADDKRLTIRDLTVQPDHIHLFVSRPPKNEPALLTNWVTPPVFVRARTAIDTPITTTRHSAGRDARRLRGNSGASRATVERDGQQLRPASRGRRVVTALTKTLELKLVAPERAHTAETL